MATCHVARQVFDLPEPQPAPVQYGARIGAFVVYLLHGHFLPEDRLAFGVRLVPATITRMSHNCARRLQGFMAAVRARVNEAKVKHLDETGFRIGGQPKWLHIASTGLLTFYRISGSRGSVPEHASGTIVHDTRGKIAFHAGKMEIERPRVRDIAGHELALPSWQHATGEDWLGKWAMNLMLLNVSTRKFRRAVRLPEGDVPAPVSFHVLRPCRHPDDREALCPLGAELRRCAPD
jgi:hypothetical protein